MELLSLKLSAQMERRVNPMPAFFKKEIPIDLSQLAAWGLSPLSSAEILKEVGFQSTQKHLSLEISFKWVFIKMSLSLQFIIGCGNKRQNYFYRGILESFVFYS